MTTEENPEEYEKSKIESIDKTELPKYMSQEKKHYYLASVDENVQTLIKEQIDDLTNVLIDLKSQYDVISRETLIKKRETEELCKKIEMLEKMDIKSKRKIEEVKEASDSVKASIQAKKQKINEENYQKKTLSNQIEKLKVDILLTKKEIINKERQTKKLEKLFEKEKEKETQLKEEKNQIFSKTMTQIKRNKFDQNEQNLQIQYYNQIIQQKNMFIKSADERKERQKKIAEEAKNDSQDKQEIELRKAFGFLCLYNKYLRTKMEKQLKENEKLEETYQQIHDICGTSNLKTIVEKILLKDKRYNDSVAKVNELEDYIKIYDEDIKLLEKQLIDLKNQVLIKQLAQKNEKEIPVEKENLIEDQEKKLIKKEEDLQNKLILYHEKNKNISLIYEKILENMRMLTRDVNETTVMSTNEQGYNIDDTLAKEGEEGEEGANNSNQMLILHNEDLKSSGEHKEISNLENTDQEIQNNTNNQDDTNNQNNIPDDNNNNEDQHTEENKQELVNKDNNLDKEEKENNQEINNEEENKENNEEENKENNEEENKLQEEINENLPEGMKDPNEGQEESKSKEESKLPEEPSESGIFNKSVDKGNVKSIEKSQHSKKPSALQPYQKTEEYDNSMTKYSDIEIDDNFDDLQLAYFKFLDDLSYKFDKLFLCYSKQQFLNYMQEKGIKISSAQGAKRMAKKLGTKRKVNKQNMKVETRIYAKEIEQDEEIELDQDAKEIFRIFKEKERQKIEDFIKNTKK